MESVGLPGGGDIRVEFKRKKRELARRKEDDWREGSFQTGVLVRGDTGEPTDCNVRINSKVSV